MGWVDRLLLNWEKGLSVRIAPYSFLPFQISKGYATNGMILPIMVNTIDLGVAYNFGFAMFRMLTLGLFFLLLLFVGLFVYVKSVSQISTNGFVWKKVDIPNVLLTKQTEFDVLVEVNEWANGKELLDYQSKKLFAEQCAKPESEISFALKLKYALLEAKIAKQNKEHDMQMGAICDRIALVYAELKEEERYVFILTLEQIDYCFDQKYSLCSTLISNNKQ